MKNHKALSKIENEVFSSWQDECCGNYVGWSREFQHYSVIAMRTNTGEPGNYQVSKVTKGKTSMNVTSDDIISQRDNCDLDYIMERFNNLAEI